MRALVLAALVVVGVTLTPAAPANAQVSAKCLSHMAKEKTTAVADRLYHLTHGGESPCEESEAVEFDAPKDNNNEGKSHYCRKHWFC